MSGGCVQFAGRVERLKLDLHRMHEQGNLMPDLFFVCSVLTETFCKRCHFGTPEAVGLITVKSVESLGASSDIRGATGGGELQ